MKNSRLPFMGALATSAVVGAASLLAIVPAHAQPLPVEGVAPQVNNLSLRLVTNDEAEKLAMPAQSIDLQLRDVTLREALQELERQSGVALDLGWADKGVLDKKLSLDLQTRFFRPAFNAILDEAGVKAQLQRWGRQEAYNVQFGQGGGDEDGGPQSGVGPFQVRLQSANANFSETVKLNAGGAPTRSQNRTLSLTLNGIGDPIVNVTGTPLIILKRVEDEQGRSLLDTNRNQWMGYQFDNSWGGGLPQNIKLPATGIKKLARVEGTAIYVVPSARQSWEIPDLLNNKNPTHEFTSQNQSIQVTVKNATRNDDALDLSIEMTTEAGGNGEQRNPLFSFGTMSRAFRVEDANGNVLRSGDGGGSSSGTKMTMRYNFARSPRGRRFDGGEDQPKPPALAEPFKLVFDSPTEWVQTEVPFSFSDVPLP